MGHRRSHISRFIYAARTRFAMRVLVLADAASLCIALVASMMLRFDGIPWRGIYHQYIQNHLISLVLSLGLYLIVFSKFRLYKYAWRFAGMETVWGVLFANSVGLAWLMVLQRVVDGSMFPVSVLIIFWFVSVSLIGIARVSLRFVSIVNQSGYGVFRSKHSKIGAKRVVILGAGGAGARVLKAVRENVSLNYKIVGFLDDSKLRIGKYVGNVRVLGPVSMLKRMVDERIVDEIIVALSPDEVRNIRDLVIDCRKKKIPVRIVPRVFDSLSEMVPVKLEDICMEDLLRRNPVSTHTIDVGSHVVGKRVLITGAGGSIGSELCRQIIALNPESIIILGHGENSLFKIQQELIRSYPKKADSIHCVVASVSNKLRLENVFERYEPQIVFHAAAHKHVPMMENNEQEAISNNVIGTYYLADLCGQYCVERMVLVSTDKAADPSNIMGATKWLCEQVVHALSDYWPDTTYITVRFGNVMGSRGSVVQLFKEQIKHGGPVTVTHPEMTRYFMTIPEAVRLVLEAQTLGDSGELYLLDMGEPMKILDLAKDMIQLCGLEPDVDIPIKFSGIRPGEKLYERLLSADEEIDRKLRNGLSIISRPKVYSLDDIINIICRINDASNQNGREVRLLLKELVPHYITSEHAAVEDSVGQIYN